MKHLLSSLFLVVAGFSVAAPAPVAPEGFPVNVTQHHNNPSRDGLIIDPAFTPAAAASLTRDLSFNGAIVGQVYAQPLYIEDGPGGAAMVIAVTQSNNVYALNAATGAIIWERNVGAPATDANLPCGNIVPTVGITGTPVVDLASRSLFFNAETEPSFDTFKHHIYSLNVDTGAINPGWPVDVGSVVSGFAADAQSSRAAMGIAGSIVYAAYGGRFGDCGSYRGRVVGVQMNNPSSIMNWATISTRAGIWGPGGIASDGTNLFVTTGNGSGGVTWSGSEAIIRLQPGPIFSGATTDFWAPTNWASLDSIDADLGGSGPILVDVPGATPSALVVALGKDGKGYLLNRNNLGGVSAPLASATVGTGSNIQAGATYRTATGTFVVFRPTSNTLTAFRITATNPPTIATGWTVSSAGRSSPFVTSTDGTNNMIVWAFGTGTTNTQVLRGYNGDTGAVIYNGGGANELMDDTRLFNTGIAARGRIYIAADNRVYAFSVPTGNPTPTPTATATATATPTATATATATPPCVRFNITINGAQEVPPNASAGTGTGTIDINTVTNQLSYNITFSGLGSAESMAHIHGFAPPGMNAGIIHNLPTGSPKIGVFNYSDAQEADILNGLSYVNIHSANFPNGEIRGQIAGPMLPCPTPTPTATATATATATPAATATATATATAAPTATATAAPSPTSSPTPAPQPLNISTRMRIQTGDNAGIGGFIITGTVPRHVLLRAIGPSLTQLGVPDALADPTLELNGPVGFATMTNNDWREEPVQESQILATGIPPTDDLESAIDATLSPGAYTAIVRGNGNTSGVGLVEIYDLGQAGLAKLANISTRAFVSTGDNAVIAGFILGGSSGNDRIVARGIGPSLTALGVPDALADPTLELRDSNGALLIFNNNWQDDPIQASELTAAGLAPTNNLESGIATTLPPGLYTALLAGLNNGTGVGLVEVYDRGAP